jgi:hypothetical protein
LPSPSTEDGYARRGRQWRNGTGWDIDRHRPFKARHPLPPAKVGAGKALRKKSRHYQQLLQQTRGLEVAAFAAGGEALDLKLRTVRRATRMVSPTAYDAGAALAINPEILRT